jgi:hypothetical protein
MDLRLDASPPLAGIAPPAAAAPPFDAGAELARDLFVVGVAFVALLAWDALGLDLPISRLFGDADGLSLARPLARLGRAAQRRALRGVAARARPRGRHLAAAAVRARPDARRARRLGPRDDRLRRPDSAAQARQPDELPVVARRVRRHRDEGLALGVRRADGGPGRCFPAGHATAAFCFLPGWFILRRAAPLAARRWLVATLAAGAVLTMVQVVRGAHYVSHSLWTGWLCCVLGVVWCMRCAPGPARSDNRA